MKYVRRTAGYTWTDYKTNAQNAKELKIIPLLEKLVEYKRNWIQHVNRMPRNRLPRVMKQRAEGIMVDLWRDFLIRETGTGQQVAQLHDRYVMMIMMMMMMMMMMKISHLVCYAFRQVFFYLQATSLQHDNHKHI